MKRTLIALCFITAFYASANSQNIYMKVDGINGDVTLKGHENEFTILAFELTGTNATTTSGGGSGVGKVSFGNAKFKKVLTPKANPDFMLYLSNGKHITTVTFMWTASTGGGGKPFTYYQVKLSNVVLTSAGILSPECVSGNCNTLFEEIHLGYDKIEWTGTPQDPNTGAPGTPYTKGWDISKNVAL